MLKSINLAPTWVWTMQVCLQLIEAGDQKKAEEGFIKEVEKLGAGIPLLLHDFRYKRTREAARKFLMDKARQMDEAITQKEVQNAKESGNA